LSANAEKRYHLRQFGIHAGIPLSYTLQGKNETIMRDRFSASMIPVAISATAISAVIAVSIIRTLAQAAAPSVPVLKTPWGEPDLQGIWTDETDTPAQGAASVKARETVPALRNT
jgi:hypothetical protein